MPGYTNLPTMWAWDAFSFGLTAILWLTIAFAVILIGGKAFLFFRGVFDRNAP